MKDSDNVDNDDNTRADESLLSKPEKKHDKLPRPLIKQPSIIPRVYKRRWLILLIFCLYSLSNAYQWIHLNIISNIIESYYNSSLPEKFYERRVAIDWLSMLYMLAYIPLIFPATWLLDKKGLRMCGLCGAFLNALGAWVKVIAVHPERFPILMMAQAVCAVAQVFILGIPARLAAVWFGPNEVSTATALGVFGNQVGVAIGFLLPPEIVPEAADKELMGKRFKYMMYGTAGFTTLIFILMVFLFKKSPPIPPSTAQARLLEEVENEMAADYLASLKRLLLNKPFVLLALTYGINTGSYYAIGTLLNPIILEYFPNEEIVAGRIGLTLVLAGVAGSIIAGFWLDKTKWYKSTTVGIYFLSFTGMIIFTLTLKFLSKIWIAFLCSGLLGFFMTGYLPVGFEFAAEITYPESEGTSSGLLNASAQAFGIVSTMGMGIIISKFDSFYANLAVSISLLVGTIGTGNDKK
ncbi:DgyrCDS7481 [Dimorphilus gyrociliatus]|uniref:Choline/ethanolamine transporter FLVCR1 n=1 Tax=Dimorphilus gyrociliatus TaxID=2664684 RepID=A0A7I8VTQ8_9ANNE|nr:DgyrCDS7481 [Dimorphilus gyrociliatus]